MNFLKNKFISGSHPGTGEEAGANQYHRQLPCRGKPAVDRLECQDVCAGFSGLEKENVLDLFIEKIQHIDEITECYIITGEADLLLKVVCKDIPTYEQLLFKTLSQIGEIERLKTLVTLSTVKDSKVLPFDYGKED